LLSMIPMESASYSSLATGQDLTVLGLDLSRPEYVTLAQSFLASKANSLVTHPYTPPLVLHS
jgi:CCR4-NOT transcription complex subunit 2